MDFDPQLRKVKRTIVILVTSYTCYLLFTVFLAVLCWESMSNYNLILFVSVFMCFSIFVATLVSKQIKFYYSITQRSRNAAIFTLELLKYTYNGGVMWRPPLGPIPDYIRSDK